MEIVNWGIIKHPVNWLTVGLMVLIAGIALHFVLSWQTNPLATTKTTS